MRRFLVYSLAAHASLFAAAGLWLCPWLERLSPGSRTAAVDVDFFKLGKNPGGRVGRGSRRAAPLSGGPMAAEQPLERFSAPEKERIQREPSNGGNPAAAKDAKDGRDAEDALVRISIAPGDGGDGSTVTLEQYMRWVVQRNRAPVYPRLAQLRGEQGRAVVELSVAQSDGRLENAEVVESSGSELLDSVSLSAVKDWHFARFESQERSIRFRVPFRFALK